MGGVFLGFAIHLPHFSPSKSISDLVNVFRSAVKGKKVFNDAVGASWKSLNMLTTADRH